MKPELDTEKTIANMIEANTGKNLTPRETYIFKESLRALVRLAKSELLFEMKSNVAKLTGTATITAARQRAKAGQRGGLASDYSQWQFEFNQFD
jgi:hypothetical protein